MSFVCTYEYKACQAGQNKYENPVQRYFDINHSDYEKEHEDIYKEKTDKFDYVGINQILQIAIECVVDVAKDGNAQG